MQVTEMTTLLHKERKKNLSPGIKLWRENVYSIDNKFPSLPEKERNFCLTCSSDFEGSLSQKLLFTLRNACPYYSFAIE
jgi:hypothetical protein